MFLYRPTAVYRDVSARSPGCISARLAILEQLAHYSTSPTPDTFFKCYTETSAGMAATEEGSLCSARPRKGPPRAGTRNITGR